MNELQRQSYLDAMGVDNLVPRLLLPGAAASPLCVIPQELLDACRPATGMRGGQARAPQPMQQPVQRGAAPPMPSAPGGQPTAQGMAQPPTPQASAAASARAEAIKASLSPESAAAPAAPQQAAPAPVTPGAEAPEPEVAATPRAARVQDEPALEPFRFTLFAVGPFAFLMSEHLDNPLGFSRAHQALLNDLCLALGIRVDWQRQSVDSMEWPPRQMRHVKGLGAMDFIKGFLNSRLTGREQWLLIPFGETAGLFAQRAREGVMPGFAMPLAAGLVGLDEMMRHPEAKKQVWQQLAPLRDPALRDPQH